MNASSQHPQCKTSSAGFESALIAQRLARHAQKQMTRRRLSMRDIAMVLEFGRLLHERGAEIYFLGRKEIKHFRQEGIPLESLNGIHVVCGDEGRILTVYRNRKLGGIRRFR